MAYGVLRMDLTTSGVKTVIEPGTEMSGVTLFRLNAGVQADMKIGGGQWIPIVGPFALELCGRDARDGFYVKNDSAQPGAWVEFLVAFSDLGVA